MTVSTNWFTSVIIGLFITLILVWITFRWRRRRYYELGNRLYGITPLVPLFGNALMFRGKLEDMSKKLIRLLIDNQSLGIPILGLWFGPFLGVVVFDAYYLSIILNSPKTLSKCFLYKIFGWWLEEGLLTAPVPKWRHRRKLITPSFNQKLLNTFSSVFQERSNALINNLKSHLGSKHVDILPYISRCTLESVNETVLGVKTRNDADTLKYFKTFEETSKLVIELIIYWWFLPHRLAKYTTIGRKYLTNIEFFNNFTNKIIEKKREQSKLNEIKNNNSMDDDDEWIKQKTRKPFLQFIIENTNLKNDELREEAKTMILGGTDTLALSCSFMVLMLAIHQKYQDKVYEEITNILGTDPNTPLNVEDLSKFSYLDLIIKETFRLYPPAPFILRDVTEEIELDEKYTLPKGCSIAIPIFAIHRNEKYWENPNDFIPERFLLSEPLATHPYAFLPFSGGIRNCPGPRYANMIQKYCMVTLLRNYKFNTNLKMNDLEIEINFLISLKNGHLVKIEKRV